MGPARLSKLEPRDRPKRPPKKRGRQPLCHGASVEARREYREQHRAFLEHYYYALSFWMRGYWDAPFPAGSMRPPLIQVAA